MSVFRVAYKDNNDSRWYSAAHFRDESTMVNNIGAAKTHLTDLSNLFPGIEFRVERQVGTKENGRWLPIVSDATAAQNTAGKEQVRA